MSDFTLLLRKSLYSRAISGQFISKYSQCPKDTQYMVAYPDCTDDKLQLTYCWSCENVEVLLRSVAVSTTSHQDTIVVNLQIENVTSLKGHLFLEGQKRLSWWKRRLIPPVGSGPISLSSLKYQLEHLIIIMGQNCSKITSRFWYSYLILGPRFLHWHHTQQEVLGTVQYNWPPRENYIRRPCRAFRPMFLHQRRLLSSLFCKFVLGT